jgi:hypothetical protein
VQNVPASEYAPYGGVTVPVCPAILQLQGRFPPPAERLFFPPPYKPLGRQRFQPESKAHLNWQKSQSRRFWQSCSQMLCCFRSQEVYKPQKPVTLHRLPLTWVNPHEYRGLIGEDLSHSLSKKPNRSEDQ